MTTFKTDEKRDWFRVFHKDVEYYTWVSDSGNIYHFTDETLDSLKSSYEIWGCLLYTSPSPRDATLSRMPSSA